MSLGVEKKIKICSPSNADLESLSARGKAYVPDGPKSRLMGVETVTDGATPGKALKPAQITEVTRFLEAMSLVYRRHLGLIPGVGNRQRLIGISPHRTFGRLGELQ